MKWVTAQGDTLYDSGWADLELACYILGGVGPIKVGALR
jgi:hypothetical protein